MWIDLTDCNHNKKSLKQHLFIKAANPTHFENLFEPVLEVRIDSGTNV